MIITGINATSIGSLMASMNNLAGQAATNVRKYAIAAIDSAISYADRFNPCVKELCDRAASFKAECAEETWKALQTAPWFRPTLEFVKNSGAAVAKFCRDHTAFVAGTVILALAIPQSRKAINRTISATYKLCGCTIFSIFSVVTAPIALVCDAGAWILGKFNPDTPLYEAADKCIRLIKKEKKKPRRKNDAALFRKMTKFFSESEFDRDSNICKAIIAIVISTEATNKKQCVSLGRLIVDAHRRAFDGREKHGRNDPRAVFYANCCCVLQIYADEEGLGRGTQLYNTGYDPDEVDQQVERIAHRIGAIVL
jgi:hypothetical protein